MPKPNTVVIHLGAHKTATTHFQATLLANEKTINDVGVSVYTPNYLRNEGFRTWNPLRGRGPNANLEFVDRKMKELSTAGRKVVLSEENLLGKMVTPNGQARSSFYPKGDIYLREFVDMHPSRRVIAAIATRNPATYLPSVYSFGLFQGRMMPFENFVETAEPDKMRWSKLIARLRAVEGLEKLIVWPYEDYRKLHTKIFRTVIKWRTGELVEPMMESVNPGLSQKAFEELKAIGFDACDAQTVKDLRDRYPASTDYPKFQPFSAPDVARITQNYQEDLELIKSLEAVTFLSP